MQIAELSEDYTERIKKMRSDFERTIEENKLDWQILIEAQTRMTNQK